MGLLRILLTEIPRESLARQHEQTATRAAASLYQETVRFGDAGSGFRKPEGMEEIGQWIISPRTLGQWRFWNLGFGTNRGAGLDPRRWRKIGLRITKFGTKRCMVTQAICAPSVVVPELKRY
jgi:hypothetical protein